MESGTPRSFAALQDLLKRKATPPPGERCDYCAVPLATEHSHMIDLHARRIMCACRPCYLVFEPQGAAQGRYKAVPTRFLEIEGFQLDSTQWDDLGIPIGLAFFFFNSVEKKMAAFYPGPAGATESLLSLEGWEAIRSQTTSKRFCSTAARPSRSVTSYRSTRPTNWSACCARTGAVSTAARKRTR